MTLPERYLLLALSLLVVRQRARIRGESSPDFFRALRQPIVFAFTHTRGAFRCALDGHGSELFFSSVLVIEGIDFVSPLSALGPHVKLMHVRGSALPEAKLSAQFGSWLGLSTDDRLYSVYSPLQLLFTAQNDFFLPHRESWHSYLGRCVAARVAGATCAASSELTRVSWPDASFEAADLSGTMLFAYDSPAARFTLKVGDNGFEVSASAREPAGLLSDLRKFVLSGAMPDGISASLEDATAVRIEGGPTA